MPRESAQNEKTSETPELLKATRPTRVRRTLTLQGIPRQNRSIQRHAKRVEVKSTTRPNVRIWSASPMRKRQHTSVNFNFATAASCPVIRIAAVHSRRRVASAERTATMSSFVDGDRSLLHQPQQWLQLMFQRRWLNSIRLRRLND